MMQLEGGEVKRPTLNQVHAAAVAWGASPGLLTTEDPSLPVEIVSRC